MAFFFQQKACSLPPGHHPLHPGRLPVWEVVEAKPAAHGVRARHPPGRGCGSVQASHRPPQRSRCEDRKDRAGRQASFAAAEFSIEQQPSNRRPLGGSFLTSLGWAPAGFPCW